VRFRSLLLVALPLAVIGMTVSAPHGHAQTRRSGSLSGTVVSADGTPIPDALVQVRREGVTYMARTDDDGAFLVPSMPAGEYTVVGKRIGFDSTALSVHVGDGRVRRELVLVARGYGADTIRIRARFAGVTGVVGDFAEMAPMSGAAVRVLGGEPPLTTDSSGRFAIELAPDRRYALRVERRGFAPQLLAFELEPEQRVELAVLLDSSSRDVKDGWKWAELDQRQRVNRYGSAQVTRAELRATEATNLHIALQYAAASTEQGLVIPRAPCLFIDGVAKPTLTLDAVAVERVEFVEVYTRSGDVSGTLATRWPVGFPCGDGTVSTGRSVVATARGNSSHARYVAIWTRAP
jgi:hypothetical protein